jgi:hypothetical protein
MTPQTLGFETWEELYDYIIESKINGQRKQSKDIYRSLNEHRRVEFIDYIDEMYRYEAMHYSQVKELANHIKFYAV